MSDELIDYTLPPDRIAQEPPPARMDSRLLVLDRSNDALEHCRFDEIVRFLRAGDVLVVNDTRVIPARLRARRKSGGAVEILLLEERPESETTWNALLRPGGKAGRPGAVLEIAGGGVTARVLGREGEVFRLELREGDRSLRPNDVVALCERLGETPLPPYIERQPRDPRSAADRERYQTVFATRPGAVAAPTAGLHFSGELLAELDTRGVERVAITLHIGLDTFRPLTTERLSSGELHGERVEIGSESGERILAARQEGRRIVALGTTSVRALESFAGAGCPLPYSDRTTLFIRPGHRFRLVDALVTNFHLPRSSLLLLVSAFAGRDRILRAYREAIDRSYRFYSYGDAMLIL